MTDETTTRRLPTGIDLGSETTVGAVADDAGVRTLEIEGESAVPTRLAVSEAGFAVGSRAVAADRGAVTPRLLPDGRTDGDETTAPPANVPLSVFLRELFDAWRTDDAGPRAPVDGDDPPDDAEDGDATGDAADPAAARENPDADADAEAEESPERPAEGGAGGTPASGGEFDFGRSEPVPDESSAESAPAEPVPDESAAGVAPGVTTVAVPGPSAAADLRRVEEAAAAAGFEGVRAVRNPVAVAATELPDCTAPKTFGVADIGATEASFAVVTVTEAGTLEVEARSTLADNGRAALDDALARWVLNEVGEEHSVTFQYDDEAMRRVRDAAHAALDEVGADGESEARVELELSEGVDVADGGWFGADALAVDVGVDIHDCYQALAERLRAIQGAISELFEATDRSTESVDELLVAGDGTRPVPVVHAVEKAFDRRSRLPARGGRYEAAAVGAALLSNERAAGSSPVAAETYDSAVELRALGESGPAYRALTSVGDGPAGPCRMRLATADESQLSGAFELWYRHRRTGARTRAATFTCSNLPADSAGVLTVSFRSEAARLDPDADPRSVVDVEWSGDSDLSEPPTVAAADDSSAPWLGYADADIESTADAARSAPDGAFVDARPSSVRAVDGVDDASLVETVHAVRNKLWERAVKDDDGFERDEIRLLVREFDGKLAKYGAEPIDPEVGSLVDGERHRILETRPDDREKGTVLEVKRPGLAVDGVVVEEAVVVASE